MKLKRKHSQVVFLALFIILLIMGRIQMWLGIFAVSLAASIYFGRFYCAYVCPINTVMEGMESTLVHERKASKGRFLRKPSLRYLVLAGMLLSFVLMRKSGIKLPILLVFFVAGSFSVLFFKPEIWHRYLCPYGAILSIVSKNNKRTLAVYKKSCIKCGHCHKICPGAAIEWKGKDAYPRIIKEECLHCGKCREECPTATIRIKE